MVPRRGSRAWEEACAGRIGGAEPARTREHLRDSGWGTCLGRLHGLRSCNGAGSAGPAGGSCGRSSAGGGKGSAFAVWSESRFPDCGKAGSSSVAAATAGAIVPVDSAGAGAAAGHGLRGPGAAVQRLGPCGLGPLGRGLLSFLIAALGLLWLISQRRQRNRIRIRGTLLRHWRRRRRRGWGRRGQHRSQKANRSRRGAAARLGTGIGRSLQIDWRRRRQREFGHSRGGRQRSCFNRSSAL